MRIRPIIVGLAALGLIAATAPAPAPAGTATATLTGVEISVTGLDALVEGLKLVDITSFASTDTDTARNEAGSPFSMIRAVPAVIAGQEVGTVTARSDQGGSQSSPGLSQAVGPLAVSVDGVQLSAVADATSAAALVDALAAQLSILEGAIGSSISGTGVTTSVDADAARAVQGLQTSGLNISLGDLLPLDALPLDVVLALAGELTGLLTGTLEGLLNEVSALYSQLRTLLSGLEVDLAQYASLTAALADDLEDLEALEAVQAELEAAIASATALLGTGATQDVIDGVGSGAGSLIDGATGTIGGALDGIVGGLSTGGSVSAQLTGDAQLTAIIADLNASLDDVESTIVAVAADIDAVVTDLVSLLDGILTDVLGVDDLVDALLAAIGDLLAQLPNVLDALGDADLVDIGEVTAGISAVAEADGGDAVLGCSATHVRVVGVSLGTPSCDAPLIETSQLLAGAIGQLKDVLGALPIVGDIVPDVTLKVFSDAHRTVEEVDGYWRASAGVNLFEFELPSIELGAVTDGLLASIADASLSQLLADLLDLLESQVDLVAEFSTLTDALTGLAAELDDAVTTVTSQVNAIVDLEAAVAGLLSGLPAIDALDGLATPGIKIVVDPVSTAEFRAGAAVPPDTTPPLPVTGGGLAILGLLALAGGAGLLRRREVGHP